MATKITSCLNYALTFAVLLIMLLVPLLSLALVFVALPLLIWVYLRRNAFLPLITLSIFLICAIISKDTLAILAFSALIAAIVGVVIAFKLKPNVVIQFCVVAGASIIGIVISVAVMCICFFASPQVIYGNYLADNSDTILIKTLSVSYYNKADEGTLEQPRLDITDEGYLGAAVTEYTKYKCVDMEKYMLWYLSGYGFMLGGVGYLLAIALARKKAKQMLIASSSNFAPQLNAPPDNICEMRLKRSYLVIAFLPAVVFSIFSVVEAMAPITVAVFNLLVTLPLAFCGFTLLLHSVEDRFYFKAKTIMRAVLIVAMILMCIFFEYGMLILSLLGFADCILNVRFLLDWALSK